ncbi:hypothetical protein BD410DRAFT_757087, partial [Rickenella mellea]
MSGGRPAGTKNKPGHAAGGAREGSGRQKKKRVSEAFTTNSQSSKGTFYGEGATFGDGPRDRLFDLFGRNKAPPLTSTSQMPSHSLKRVHPVDSDPDAEEIGSGDQYVQSDFADRDKAPPETSTSQVPSHSRKRVHPMDSDPDTEEIGSEDQYAQCGNQIGDSMTDEQETHDTSIQQDDAGNLSDSSVDSDFFQEEDDDDDFDEVNDMHSGQHATAANEEKLPVSGVVKNYLASLLQDIKAQIQLKKMPDCYRAGHFWIYPRDPFFAMQKAVQPGSGSELTPNDLYHPLVFLWVPTLLDSTPLTCSNRSCKYFQNKSKPLTKGGWNNNPVGRRVISLDSMYYIITKRVECSACDKSWNLYDPLIMNQLDRGLVAEFPAFLTHRSGIDKKTMTLIRAGMAHRVSSRAWSNILRELHMREYDLRQTFTSHFTVVNEFEEIRYQAFTPTKSLSHIKGAMQALTKSLEDHGHSQPILGFTDNVASDLATFLECIPSLGKDV